MQQRYMQHISDTSYCHYSVEEGCCNQYTLREEIQEGVEMENCARESECLEDGPNDPGYICDEWV